VNVKSNNAQFTVVHGLMANDIGVIFKSVTCSGTSGNSDHADLEKAMPKMHIKEGSLS
jgi:hypothetical protein